MVGLLTFGDATTVGEAKMFELKVPKGCFIGEESLGFLEIRSSGSESESSTRFMLPDVLRKLRAD